MSTGTVGDVVTRRTDATSVVVELESLTVGQVLGCTGTTEEVERGAKEAADIGVVDVILTVGHVLGVTHPVLRVKAARADTAKSAVGEQSNAVRGSKLDAEVVVEVVSRVASLAVGHVREEDLTVGDGLGLASVESVDVEAGQANKTHVLVVLVELTVGKSLDGADSVRGVESGDASEAVVLIGLVNGAVGHVLGLTGAVRVDVEVVGALAHRKAGEK